MTKIFMFVNVDWFFLSHRLPIALVAAERNIEMRVFAEFTQKQNKEYESFSFVPSPLTRTYKGFFRSFFEFFKILALLIAERPHVIHAVTIKPIIFLGLACYCLNLPFVASISGLGPAFTPSSNWGEARLLLVKLIYRIVFSPDQTRVICQSSHDADVLVQNRLVARSKITIIDGSGVNLEEYQALSQEKTKPINVLMACRFLADKGVREFCSTAGVINKQQKYDVTFSLAGSIDLDSPAALSHSEVIQACKDNDVQFLGSRSDMNKLLAKTDIFVLPSYYAEGIPKVLIEAAASGCAVITTDHPGCRDAILPGVTGILVETRDISSLTNALQRLLSDREMMVSMGKAGRQMALERFCINRVVDAHYEIYRAFGRGETECQP